MRCDAMQAGGHHATYNLNDLPADNVLDQADRLGQRILHFAKNEHLD
jgi:hypothetical protein